MPPLDLDAMVRGDVGGGSVACGNPLFDDSDTEGDDACFDDPYAPAQSLRLRIGEDIDWCDVGGAVVAVLRRDDSTKGAGANPKSAARRSVQQQAAAPRSSMSAAPRKAAAAVVVIGGLPPGKAARERPRCSPCRLGGGARVFAAGEQAAGHLVEPGSPKVSCLGAVRSEHRPVASGMGRRAWWPWLAGSVTCCFSSRRRGAPKGSEADD